MRPIIDMSLETNFGMRFRRRPFLGPVYRPRDIISTIITAVSTVIANLVPAWAGATAYLIAANLVYGLIYGVMIGLSIWSMSGGKKSGGPESSLEQNGQLVNTRQSSKPLPVIYGVCKIGRNRVFRK
jgi:hypothetical protein